MKLNSLEKRIIEICYKNKISHIGSSISCVNIIDNIYKKNNLAVNNNIFILSSGHAGIALYVILEKYFGLNAEQLYLKHGLHPHRDIKDNIYCSTGSLAMGITVGVGAALANKNKNIHILISDGECYEGAVWESLSFIKEQKLDNIKIYVNLNGLAAYKEVDKKYLKQKLLSFLPNIDIIETNFADITFLNGLEAHYKLITEKEYNDLQ